MQAKLIIKCRMCRIVAIPDLHRWPLANIIVIFIDKKPVDIDNCECGFAYLIVFLISLWTIIIYDLSTAIMLLNQMKENSLFLRWARADPRLYRHFSSTRVEKPVSDI